MKQKNITSKTIKLDYCEKIRELNQMRVQIMKLEDENRLLHRQREDMRREKLQQAQAMAIGEDVGAVRWRTGFRQGLLVGAMLIAGVFAAVIYAATH